MTIKFGAALIVGALSLTLGLSACATKSDQATAPVKESSGWFGLGKGSTSAPKADATGIGVNAYLWRSTLDTLSFMPLAAADPWGGVIMTDWYVDPQVPNQRFKATVYILDSRLRADALNVSIFKEVNSGGAWVASEVSAQTQVDIENAILTRARELRLSDVRN